MPKRRSKQKKPLLVDLIKRKDWDAVENRLNMHNDEPSKQILLGAACDHDPPVDIIAHLIAAYPYGLEDKNVYGSIPLHGACHKSANIEVIKMLVYEYPHGLNVKNYFGNLPIDYATSEEIKLILVRPSTVQRPIATIEHGVGGEKFTRGGRAVEEGQIIAKIEVFQVTLCGKLPKFLGVLHSIVKITYNTRTYNTRRTEKSLWVERVCRLDGNNVEITQDMLDSHGRTVFRMAEYRDLKLNLSLYVVLEQAMGWGRIPYCIHYSNCHVLAVDLFNFCLAPGSEQYIPPDQIPNRNLSKLALLLGPIAPISSDTTAGCQKKSTPIVKNG